MIAAIVLKLQPHGKICKYLHAVSRITVRSSLTIDFKAARNYGSGMVSRVGGGGREAVTWSAPILMLRNTILILNPYGDILCC